jgi:hypothetical protein
MEDGEVMWVKPLEKGYSKKWNMVKNFPGGMSKWSPNLEQMLDRYLKNSSINSPSGNNTVVHNRLVRLVLEVRLPSAW